MWITKLRLTNIKSYGTDAPEIHFVEGVNLIQGHNGAGKSTILEAIGLALFGSSPYTLNQILREGCKSGEIAVNFISFRDGREYQVVRRLGGGGTATVFDTETERNLCGGVKDTADFVREHLGVESDADLKALFEDAVGVPQGTMTAIFLENVKTRKGKFDGLLRVNDYEKVWDKLRETGSYIDGLLKANDEEQARLDGVLSDLPVVNDAIVALTASLAAAQQKLSQLEESLQVVTAAVEAGQATKDQLDDLVQQLGKADLTGQRLGDQVQRAEAIVQEATAAAVVVADTAAAHESYEAALALIDELEDKRHTLDQLTAEQATLNTALSVGQLELANAQQALVAVEAAAAELERLEPLLEQQAQLATALQEAETAHETYVQLKARVQQAVADQETLAARAAAARQLFDEASLEVTQAAGEAAANRPELSDDLGGQLTILRETVTKMETAAERYDDSQQVRQTAQAELADLQDKVEQRAAFQTELEALLVQVKAGAEQVRVSQVQIAQAAGELEKLAEYEQLLGGPGAVCPVCQRPLDDHAYADTVQHYETERTRLGQVLQAAQAELNAVEGGAVIQAREQADLEMQIADLPGPAVLTMAQSRFNEAQDTFAARRQTIVGLIIDTDAHFDQLERLLAREQQQVDSLADTEARITTLQAELTDLGDPRRHYEQAAEQVEKRPDLAAAVETQQAMVDNLAGQLSNLAQQLEPFAGLDAELTAARQQRDTNQAANQQYLTHAGVAEKLAARQADLAALQEQHSAHQAELTQLAQAHDALAAAFDSEAFAAQQANKQALLVERATVRANLDNDEKNLTVQQDRLARLEAAQLERETCERAAARLETRLTAFRFVRENIRQAGPQITQQLVQLIAEHANHIFGDILDDHSLVLNWNADYSVSVLAQGEERDFGLLSGGEQMAAAIALRLALLDHLGNVQFAFFDEPTTNLDDTRRSQLAERLAAIQSLKQLFVISHDDTFEQESYHVVQVSKVGGLSQVETR